MSTDRKPKRRPFQFRLLGLLVVVTLVAIGAAMLRDPLLQTRIDSGASERVEELGGTSTWGGLGQGRGKPGRAYLGAIDLTGTAVTDDDLVEIGGLTELTHLVLNNTKITDAGLAHLAQLPNLKQLELSGTSITNDGVHYIANLPKLEVLILKRCNISDGAVSDLTGLNSLVDASSRRYVGDRRGVEVNQQTSCAANPRT